MSVNDVAGLSLTISPSVQLIAYRRELVPGVKALDSLEHRACAFAQYGDVVPRYRRCGFAVRWRAESCILCIVPRSARAATSPDENWRGASASKVPSISSFRLTTG